MVNSGGFWRDIYIYLTAYVMFITVFGFWLSALLPGYKRRVIPVYTQYKWRGGEANSRQKDVLPFSICQKFQNYGWVPRCHSMPCPSWTWMRNCKIWRNQNTHFKAPNDVKPHGGHGKYFVFFKERLSICQNVQFSFARTHWTMVPNGLKNRDCNE